MGVRSGTSIRVVRKGGMFSTPISIMTSVPVKPVPTIPEPLVFTLDELRSLSVSSLSPKHLYRLLDRLFQEGRSTGQTVPIYFGIPPQGGNSERFTIKVRKGKSVYTWQLSCRDSIPECYDFEILKQQDQSRTPSGHYELQLYKNGGINEIHPSTDLGKELKGKFITLLRKRYATS